MPPCRTCTACALLGLSVLFVPHQAMARQARTSAVFIVPPDSPGTPAPDGNAVGTADGLRSLLVPGWGQLRQERKRAWVYAAAEVAGWVGWATLRHGGATLRSRYRDLAWSAARVRAGDRVDGDFAYYETLSKWDRSGAFDADPARVGVQPEPDPGTYNGSVWALALQIFVPSSADPSDPAYARALAYYADHAYGEGFRWDWTGHAGELADYRSLIHRSDQRFRRAGTALGLVLLNHFASGVDALLTARTDGRAGVSSGPAPRPGAWDLSLRFSPGRTR